MQKESIIINTTSSPQKNNKKKSYTKSKLNQKFKRVNFNTGKMQTPKIMTRLPNLSQYISSTTAYQHSYARSVVLPEFARGSKIPSVFPQPTASLHKHMTIPISASSNGKAAIVWNPYFLSDTTYNKTMLLLNNSSNLNLVTAETSAGFAGVPTNFGMPPNVLNTFRLVSASISIVPQMSLQTAQGSIAGGVYQIGDDLNSMGYAPGTPGQFVLPALTVAANIDNVLYFKKANVTALESIRHVYFPLDPSYETYIKGNSSHQAIDPTDFVFTYYITGAPANANFNLELYVNFEWMPSVYAQSYVPMDTYSGNEKSESVIKSLSQAEILTSQVGSDIQSQLNEIDTIEKTMGARYVNTGTTGYRVQPATSKSNWINSIGSFFKDNGGDILKIASTLLPLI